MMERTGGGFLKSGRMSQGLPEVQSPKPLQLPQGSVSQGPQPQAQPGGYLGAQAPQGMPPEPAMPQGAPQGQPMPEQGAAPEGVNHVANNALRLLHDEQAGPEFEQMIAQGPDGAAQALATIYTQVRQGYEAQGEQIDEAMAGEAADEVMEDVAAIGQAVGAFPQGEQDIEAFVVKAMDLLGGQFPELAQGFAEMAQDRTPEEDAAGRAIGERMGQGRQPGMAA